jgi:hypothetical protein
MTEETRKKLHSNINEDPRKKFFFLRQEINFYRNQPGSEPNIDAYFDSYALGDTNPKPKYKNVDEYRAGLCKSDLDYTLKVNNE